MAGCFARTFPWHSWAPGGDPAGCGVVHVVVVKARFNGACHHPPRCCSVDNKPCAQPWCLPRGSTTEKRGGSHSSPRQQVGGSGLGRAGDRQGTPAPHLLQGRAYGMAAAGIKCLATTHEPSIRPALPSRTLPRWRPANQPVQAEVTTSQEAWWWTSQNDKSDVLDVRAGNREEHNSFFASS